MRNLHIIDILHLLPTPVTPWCGNCLTSVSGRIADYFWQHKHAILHVSLGMDPPAEQLKKMVAESPTQLNFTGFLTLMGENLHGKSVDWGTTSCRGRTQWVWPNDSLVSLWLPCSHLCHVYSLALYPYLEKQVFGSEPRKAKCMKLSMVSWVLPFHPEFYACLSFFHPSFPPNLRTAFYLDCCPVVIR